MKIDNSGRPNYEPRPRGQKKSGGNGDWLFWVCVVILVVAVLGML